MNRFYKSVSTKNSEPNHWLVYLDEKPLATPAKNEIILPNKFLANLLAGEWRAQQKKVEPLTMPFMRLVNTAFDGVAKNSQAIKEDIVRFAANDMLCYRATAPQKLIEAQNKQWDKWLDYAQNVLHCTLITTQGIVPIKQSEKSIAAINVLVGKINEPLLLASLHVATSLCGSAILALAIFNGDLQCNDAWQLAHLDEDFNRRQWGEDSQAQARRNQQFLEMKTACLVMEHYAKN